MPVADHLPRRIAKLAARTSHTSRLVCGALLLTLTLVTGVGAAGAQDASAPAASSATRDDAATTRHSDRLAQIKRRGSLIVGVKTDYPPFGTVNAAGLPVGFEHDLAENLAQRIGVTLSKVSVTSANRLQKLAEGTVDLIIATQGDTAERRKIATQIEPNYYASGVTLLVPPDSTLREWSEVRGQKVCVAQGSYFNREMARRYLFEPQLFNNARDARLAVRDKRCIGFLYDNTALAGDIAKPEWSGYKLPLPAALVTPWAIAIASGEDGSDFAALVSDAVVDWHRSGFLLEREKAWQIAPAKFLREMHARWTEKTDDGDFVCRRLADATITPQCRNPVFLAPTEMGGLRRLANAIADFSGLELTLLYDAYDRAAFFSGLAMTLLLTVCCVAGSLAVGVALAFAAERGVCGIPGVRALTRFAAVCGRMTPPLLQIYLLVFGVGSLLSAHGWSLSPLLAVIVCLSFYTGSSIMVFIVEAAAIRRHDEPGFVLHLSTLPALTPWLGAPVVSSLVNVAKATMMSSAVAVPELLSATTSIMSEHGNVATMMNLVLLTFLLLIFAVMRALTALERRLLARHAATVEASRC